MAINKKLIHFKKLADFETRLANNEILDTSIVFIQDANKIWTHGTYYDGSDLEQYALKSSIPTKVSQLQNDSGYVNRIPTELNVVENLEIGSIIQDSVFYDFESEGKPVIVQYNSRNYFISKFDIQHAAEGIVYAYSIIDNILYTLEIGVSPYDEDVEGYNVLNIDEIQKTFYFTESFDINEFALKSSLPTKTSQ